MHVSLAPVSGVTRADWKEILLTPLFLHFPPNRIVAYGQAESSESDSPESAEAAV